MRPLPLLHDRKLIEHVEGDRVACPRCQDAGPGVRVARVGLDCRRSTVTVVLLAIQRQVEPIEPDLAWLWARGAARGARWGGRGGCRRCRWRRRRARRGVELHAEQAGPLIPVAGQLRRIVVIVPWGAGQIRLVVEGKVIGTLSFRFAPAHQGRSPAHSGLARQSGGF